MPGGGGDAQQDIGREQAAEQHDFGGEEQPHAEVIHAGPLGELGEVAAGAFGRMQGVGEDADHQFGLIDVVVSDLRLANSEDGLQAIDDVRRTDLSMRVTGEDGFAMDGASSLSKISRDPLDLVGQAIGVSLAGSVFDAWGPLPLLLVPAAALPLTGWAFAAALRRRAQSAAH